MKKISLLFALIAFVLCSCSYNKPDPSIHYSNIDFIIKQKDEESSTVKYHGSLKRFILVNTKDTTLMGEYTHIRNNGYNYFITDSMYYNSKVGDTIHFDYILKSRFFHKTK